MRPARTACEDSICSRLERNAERKGHLRRVIRSQHPFHHYTSRIENHNVRHVKHRSFACGAYVRVQLGLHHLCSQRMRRLVKQILRPGGALSGLNRCWKS